MAANTGSFRDRNGLALVALAASVVLLVALNILAGLSLPAARLDLTADRLYSLSGGTRQVLRELKEPITLRFYLSERLTREVPSYATYANRVRDMLREYAAQSGGRITLEVYNPLPFSDLEDRATAYGLQGVPLDQGGEQVYFGLAGTNSTDDEQVIAFFQPERERFLEYDLTKLVNALARPKQRVAGLITTLPMSADPTMAGQRGPQGWAVLDQIRQAFTLRELGTDVTEIAADIDVLMVVHPSDLKPQTRYAIDQYVLKGGKALVFVDPFDEGAAYRGQMMAMRGMPSGLQPSSSLDDLFKAWGLSLAKDVVIGDRRLARRVSTGGQRAQPIDYVAWLTAGTDVMNHDVAITGQLQTLNFASAGVLAAAEGAETKFEPLVTSSAQSMKIPLDKVKTNPDPAALLRQFQAGGEQLTIAARVSGHARTAFPDGPPPPPEPAPPAAGQPPAPVPPPAAPAAPQVRDGDIRVVVVADVDMLEDRFWVQIQDFFGQKVATPTANNADFVVNALDDLSGSEALIGLRSRGISDRPFERVREIQRVAEGRYRESEQALQDKLKEAERKLTALRGGSAAGPAAAGPAAAGGAPAAKASLIGPDQARQIEEIRAEIIDTRAQLRGVQRSLRENIEWLKSGVEFVTIGAVPLLLTLAAILVGLARRSRRNAAPPRRA